MVSKEVEMRKDMASAAMDGQRSRTSRVITRAALSTLLLCGAAAAAVYGLPHGVAQQSDQVSQTEAQARLAAFHALAPLDLAAVAHEDLNRALQSMNLDTGAAEALRAALNDGVPSPKVAPVRQSSPGAQSANSPTNRVPDAGAIRRLQLVWITLWDTDVEDGDVVRIDSEGYSRTVRLTKKGDTFAVPVPIKGEIKVTGVKDGDGGGITVGLASGNVRAIFPIMSEGQELGLKVKVN
jgi:hypothetical protein